MTPTSRVFHRVLSRDLPVAVRARGVWIEDAGGGRYLDAAGGAIVVNVGHGDQAVVEAMSEQAALLPVDEARIYPVSGGSEAVETAIKLARSYHLARGEDRAVVIGRAGSYHGS